jgi:ABC-2 type transport system ATP-binding protein
MVTASALRAHIEDALRRGASRDDLALLLQKAGWPRAIVQEYLGEKGEKEEINSPALVKLKGVTKRFGENTVLDNIDLSVPPGELFGIIGLSGGGKTTLLNVLVGFLEPDAGDVVLQLPDKSEVSVSKARDLVRRMFGFAAQIPSFYGKLSVRENIEHFASLYNIPAEERILRCDRLLRMVGLEDAQHTLAQNLSGGMQKRLDIACAVVHKPSILILDEPTADLDQIIRGQLWDLIRQINKQGTTVIVASHVVSELEQYCTRIAIMRTGRITEVGTTAQLRDIYSTKYEVFLSTAKKEYAKLRAFCSKKRSVFADVSIKDGQFFVQTGRPQEAVQQLLRFLAQAGDSAVQLRVDRPSIAEVFEALIRNERHPLH